MQQCAKKLNLGRGQEADIVRRRSVIVRLAQIIKWPEPSVLLALLQV